MTDEYKPPEVQKHSTHVSFDAWEATPLHRSSRPVQQCCKCRRPASHIVAQGDKRALLCSTHTREWVNSDIYDKSAPAFTLLN